MHNNSDSTNIAPVGGDGGARHSRRGRSRHHRPIIREDLGKWIWIDEPREPHNFHLYARKLFELADRPTQAVLKAGSDARYKLYVNGQYVGKGPVRSRGGVTYYDTYDITGHLNKGGNVIAFHAYHIGDPTNFAALKRPGLICKAEITVRDQVVILATDETWKVHKAEDWTDQGARMTSSLGYQEVYDASAEIEGWNEVKFNEKGWRDAVVVGAVPAMPWGDLVEREIPPLAEVNVYPTIITGLFNSPGRSKDTPASEVPRIMAASELVELRSGNVKGAGAFLTAEGTTHITTPRGDVGVVAILDFGREVFGNVEIGISGSGSGVIDIGYSEQLEDGRVKPDRAEVEYADRIILTNGRLEWQGFEPRAFRYMQIEFRQCPKTVALDYVRVNETLYPVRHTGSFECSDSLLNDIWRIGSDTVRLCMEDTYIDSPWRERAQWWGDARVQSRSAFYAFDDTRLLAQGLRQIASQQESDGALPGMYPGGADKIVPDYALYWVFSLLDYYAFADDAGLLRDLYGNLERVLAWFGGHVDADGLLCDIPGWPFIDLAEVDTSGQATSLNCLYYHALRVAGVIAAIIGREDHAEDYQQAAARLRLAINKFLYSPKRGMYADCRVDGVLVEKFSRQTNILAALFDVPDHYRKAGILRILTNASLPEIETPYFASHLVEVLCANDRHVDALQVIRKRWGAMVRAGAATFWELFNGEGSLCHGWSSGPVRDLIAEIVGIKPVIGSHRFSVSPHIGDLKWAKGTIDTKVGPLSVEWKIVRSALSISVDVPQGIKVDVYPPCPPNSSITVDGKPHVSPFVTLSGGSHVVHVSTERPPKQAPYDRSLEPTPMPHVEILGEALTRGRRRLGLTTTRRTRSRRDSEPIVETGIVERDMLETPVELIPEEQPEIAAEETADSAHKSRRRRSRRGGHGRSRASEAEQVPGEAIEPAEVERVAVEPEQVAQPAEQAGKSRRRRSRRGGRGKAVVESEAPAAETQPEPEPQVTQAAAEPADTGEAPAKSRRRRSRGGRRGRSNRPEHESSNVPETGAPVAAAAEAPIVQAVEHEAPATHESGPQPRKRRPHRHGRKPAAGPTEEHPSTADVPPVAAEPVQPPVEAGEPRRRRTHTRRPRRKAEPEQP